MTKKQEVKSIDQQISVIKSLVGMSLIVSVISILIAVTAYNRSGLNLGTELAIVGDEIVLSAESSLALVQAQAALAAARADFMIDRNYEKAAQAVAALRQDLRQNFTNAKDEVYQLWQEMDLSLEQLENDLRNQSAQSINSFQRSLEKIENNIKTDKQSQ